MSKTFLSIASGPGIGLATARRFGREGYRVVLAARNIVRLQAEAAKLRGEGIEATTVQVDAADALSVGNAVTSIGPELEVMHYNGGIMHHDTSGTLQTRSLADETIDSLVSDTKVNVSSALAADSRSGADHDRPGPWHGAPHGRRLVCRLPADFLTLSVGKAGTPRHSACAVSSAQGAWSSRGDGHRGKALESQLAAVPGSGRCVLAAASTASR